MDERYTHDVDSGLKRQCSLYFSMILLLRSCLVSFTAEKSSVLAVND